MKFIRRLAAAMAVVMAVFQAAGAWACMPTYVVTSGDTLSKIALAQMGSVLDYQAIYTANRDVIGPDPDIISVGMQLNLPCSLSADNPVDWAVLPDASTVASLLDSDAVQILDIRSPNAVAKGVIPGAVSVPFSEWRGPKGNRGEPPTDVELSRIVGDAGLQLEKPVVIVHDKPGMMDKGRAAVIYWLLKSSGFDQLAIMNEGFKGWTDAGLPVAAEPSAPRSYRVDLLFSNKWRADEVDVYGIATSQVAGFLLDARPANVFSKLSGDGTPVATTLPEARNAPVAPLMASFKPGVSVAQGVQDVVDHLQRNNADWRTGKVVNFCQTGELAALTWFYASELAGLDNVVLYPESVAGWKDSGGHLFVGTSDG